MRRLGWIGLLATAADFCALPFQLTWRGLHGRNSDRPISESGTNWTETTSRYIYATGVDT
jgi:hypothetical protein